MHARLLKEIVLMTRKGKKHKKTLVKRHLHCSEIQNT